MQENPLMRRAAQAQSVISTLLLLATLALLLWLSQRYSVNADWTYGARNTLSPESQALLTQLDGPVQVTAYARENEILRRHIENLLNPYQRDKRDIQLEFVNPDLRPETVRELGISVAGELIVRHGQRQERVTSLSEQDITDALLRLVRRGSSKAVFLVGHGERGPSESADHGFSRFAARLADTGFEITELNLAIQPRIPEDTSILVLGGPQATLLPEVARLLRSYLDAGGNLLWLADPNGSDSLESLAESLGFAFLPGIVVDASTRVLGISDPTMAMVAEYPDHAVTKRLRLSDKITLLPRVAALDAEPADGWTPLAILQTLTRSWTETGELDGTIGYQTGTDERPGPLNVGMAFTRPRGTDQSMQRAVVVGDSDFLSNRYLSYGGNLDLGLSIFNWLSGDDAIVAISPRQAPDHTLQLSNTALAVISGGFVLVLPLLLIGAGIWVAWRRRLR